MIQRKKQKILMVSNTLTKLYIYQGSVAPKKVLFDIQSEIHLIRRNIFSIVQSKKKIYSGL